MPKKQNKPEEGWNRVVGFKTSPEQDAALEDAMRAYRKRTGEAITRADIARDFGASAFVRKELGPTAWPEKRAERS